jgi:methylenetetrahydrofolate reductase (NADPH)
VPLLKSFMQRVDDLGLLEKVFILVGVGPLRSAKAASWMRAHVPGVHIPDAIIERIAGAEDQALEGRRLCVDVIRQIREIKGVRGVHVMAYRQEEAVADVITQSGVLDGRVPWYPDRDRSPQSHKEAS